MCSVEVRYGNSFITHMHTQSIAKVRSSHSRITKSLQRTRLELTTIISLISATKPSSQWVMTWAGQRG